MNVLLPSDAEISPRLVHPQACGAGIGAKRTWSGLVYVVPPQDDQPAAPWIDPTPSNNFTLVSAACPPSRALHLGD